MTTIEEIKKLAIIHPEIALAFQLQRSENLTDEEMLCTLLSVLLESRNRLSQVLLEKIHREPPATISLTSREKRYLLFGGELCYGTGGWKDFIDSFDSVEDATRSYSENTSAIAWFQVVDMTSGEIVAQSK